jgi:DNA-binding NarL/FixJ family response regulator
MNGAEVLKCVPEHEFEALLLTMQEEEHYAVRALKAGAARYVTTDSASA